MGSCRRFQRAVRCSRRVRKPPDKYTIASSYRWSAPSRPGCARSALWRTGDGSGPVPGRVWARRTVWPGIGAALVNLYFAVAIGRERLAKLTGDLFGLSISDSVIRNISVRAWEPFARCDSGDRENRAGQPGCVRRKDCHSLHCKYRQEVRQPPLARRCSFWAYGSTSSRS